ncbi:MAG TPA: hypothetical protein VKN14_14805 [Flavobacteriaceae bacterium]|nr:hypothetical protein [Flavobacteriaceae bacterium]
MNYLSLVLVCLTVLCCKAKKDMITHNMEHYITTECPEDGDCTFEVLQNKSLKKLKGSLGELYYKVVDGDKILLKFEYERDQIPNTVDGHYIEQVFLELDGSSLEVELKSAELKNVKATFARFCYCKGQTGYYEIDEGNLLIKKTEDKNYQLDFSFKITQVPQIITEIHELFSLD